MQLVSNDSVFHGASHGINFISQSLLHLILSLFASGNFMPFGFIFNFLPFHVISWPRLSIKLIPMKFQTDLCFRCKNLIGKSSLHNLPKNRNFQICHFFSFSIENRRRTKEILKKKSHSFRLQNDSALHSGQMKSALIPYITLFE